MSTKSQPNQARPSISEDWLAVLIAFLVLILSTIGLLGPNGIKIGF